MTNSIWTNRWDSTDPDNPSPLNSESGLTMLPKAWKGDGTVPGIIFCHGHGGTEFEANSHEGGAVTMRRLVEEVVLAGFPVLSGYFGGNVWGNPATMTKVTAARNYLQTNLGAKTGKVAFITQSMGNLTALNWIALSAANKTATSCVFSSMGVCDLQDIYAAGAYNTTINAAYGGAYNNATQGAASNPTTNAAPKYNGLRFLYSGGTSDTTCPPATSLALCNAIGATATRRQVAGTHAWATVGNYDIPEIVNFFKTYHI